MDFKKFLSATSSEDLEKMAEQAQDEMFTKMEERLLPLFEKCAQYTAYLLKCADEQLIEPPVGVEGVPNVSDTPKPTTGSRDNQEADGNVPNDLIDKNNVIAAIRQAVEAGKAEMIPNFVKTVAGAKPESLNEVVKIIKIELQAMVSEKKLDEESAVSIGESLNQFLGE